MNSMTFEKPPLIELIAELRWGDPTVILPPNAGANDFVATQAGSLTFSKNSEELFKRFGTQILNDGYSNSERLIPNGFPLMPYQPVFRYRNQSSGKESSLYQIGSGIFTANITPPYQSWSFFRSIVESGVTKLIDSLKQDSSSPHFNTALLRYIDAFGADFTDGLAAIDFVNQKLGFNIQLPEAISSLSASSEPIKPQLHFGIKLQDGMQMNIAIGEGYVNGQSVLLMDTTILTNLQIPLEVNLIMEIFDKAHTIIHDTFIGITKPLESIMKPLEG